jgi:hypothetical protein
VIAEEFGKPVYRYRRINDCKTYKSWRYTLKKGKEEWEPEQVAALKNCLQVRARKPGRDRLKGGGINRTRERETAAFLRSHGEEGFDVQ